MIIWYILYHFYYRQLTPGDQIAVGGKLNGVQYFHHGIYVGGNIGVIHYGGENKTNAVIKDDDITVFWGSNKLMKITYPKRKARDPEDVIKTAKRLKDNPAQWGSYDLIKNNCEHFATYCKIGKAVSTQVDEKIKIMVENRKPIAATALSASGSAGAYSLFNKQ